MNASKENAKKANREIEKAALLLDKAVGNPGQRDEIKTHLLRVQNFIEAAERKLPTEAAYERDQQRRKSKKANS